MEDNCTIVLDIGKSNAKATLWTSGGESLARRSKPNASVAGRRYAALDAAGLEAWVAETLREFSSLAQVGAIIPVTHGAAAALIHKGALFTPAMDYEADVPARDRALYLEQRDAFAETGSPALPLGLNLGLQLHALEALTGPWPEGLQIVPWPQYWAWRLSGVAASEVSSLGCHTDLWRPYEGAPSELSLRRGWAARMAALRRAGEALGPLTPEWVKRTGLPRTCQVLCGLHDSNAALSAARGHPAIAQNDATILSTGTWFVAMRSPDPDQAAADRIALPEGRDCLVNVDVAGRPVPSARFMGGRECELMAGLDIFHLTDNYDPQALIARLPSLVAEGVFALPGSVAGVGPFPGGGGGWSKTPRTPNDKRAVIGLYLALMADACLDLIGSRERLLIEGRFAEAEVFVRALASLRPGQKVYVSNAHDDVPYGALRLIHPDLAPPSALRAVSPLEISLDRYRAGWREAVGPAA